MLAYFVISVILSLRGDVARQRWFLRLATWMIPVPFIACEMGWVTAEVGRQPWTVFGMLPTWMSASSPQRRLHDLLTDRLRAAIHDFHGG